MKIKNIRLYLVLQYNPYSRDFKPMSMKMIMKMIINFDTFVGNFLVFWGLVWPGVAWCGFGCSSGALLEEFPPSVGGVGVRPALRGVLSQHPRPAHYSPLKSLGIPVPPPRTLQKSIKFHIDLCSVFAMSLQCLCNVFAVSLQCLCNVFAVSLQCLSHLFAVSLQCLCSVLAVSLQCRPRVLGEGRVGVKPLLKEMWVVGLNDGCGLKVLLAL